MQQLPNLAPEGKPLINKRDDLDKSLNKSLLVEPSKADEPVKPEPVQIVEIKAEDGEATKPELPERASESSEAKLQLPNQPAGKSPNRLQARSPRRRSSKSPMPRNKMRSPLPGAKEKCRPPSKSPLPKGQTKSPNKPNEEAAVNKPQKQKQEDTKEDTKKEDAKKEGTKKEDSKKEGTKTPTPVRFVPYTEIERECLEKFDELNKQFTEKVETRSWPEASELAKSLYRCYLTYYRSDFAAEITLHLVQILQIKRNILREKFNLENDEVAELFNELKTNILVTHGVGHQLYRKDFLDILQTIEATTKLTQA